MASTFKETKGFNISRMTEHDLVEVVEIEETSGLSRWGWDAYHAELAQVRRSVMLVARVPDDENINAGHTIQGFIASRLVADELHINNVAVRQEYRRQGIARKLLDSVLEEALRLSAKTAFLEVRAGNVPAQALYSRCGFTIAGRRPGYYTQPAEDALVMSLVMRSWA